MAAMTAAQSPAGPLLSVRDLAVVFRTRTGEVPAVREVSFDLARGEIFGLVGESGSGKSTVLTALTRMLARNARITSGRIGFDGADLLALREPAMRRLRGDRIGLIPQRPMTSLSPATSIGRQLRWHLDGLDDAGRLKELLGGVGLDALLDRLDGYPFEFSGGQLQRLLIAVAALGKQPDLLLADEPTTTLDATVQAQVLRLLLELRDRVGSAMVFVTHDLGVISQISDRIGVMYAGRLVEVAPARELFAAPRHPYTRALLEAIPVRHRRGEPLRTIPGTVTGANRLSGCPFAPRCPIALDLCREENPAPRETGLSLVRCHRAGEDL
ncbi:ABC transporter ATP-binding protein [Microbispora sp. H10836]|uniref:ABC transporter ATP-binding protein n=1 Tax=Microbispora sp. H10836 TaxID=2729106 RepID=UPI001B8ADD30|nr:ABC transporter ATP-binding protein [Microbispora sp. H10836]